MLNVIDDLLVTRRSVSVNPSLCGKADNVSALTAHLRLITADDHNPGMFMAPAARKMRLDDANQSVAS